MKLLLISTLLLAARQNASRDLPYVRTRIQVAANSKAELKQFLRDFGNRSLPEVYGYRALALFMLAKHEASPLTKLKRFADGRKQLEQVIARQPRNIELRLIRLSVQREVPVILGYTANITEDEAIIREGYRRLSDPDLKQRIARYFLQNSIDL